MSYFHRTLISAGKHIYVVSILSTLSVQPFFIFAYISIYLHIFFFALFDSLFFISIGLVPFRSALRLTFRSASPHGIFLSRWFTYARSPGIANQGYPRRVGRIKWKENIWTRISAYLIRKRHRRRLYVFAWRIYEYLEFPAKRNSIGDEIGTDQASGKLRKNRDAGFLVSDFIHFFFFFLFCYFYWPWDPARSKVDFNFCSSKEIQRCFQFERSWRFFPWNRFVRYLVLPNSTFKVFWSLQVKKCLRKEKQRRLLRPSVRYSDAFKLSKYVK